MRNRKINSSTGIGVYGMEGTQVRNLESKSDLASPKIIQLLVVWRPGIYWTYVSVYSAALFCIYRVPSAVRTHDR